jgi:hypothetical protein
VATVVKTWVFAADSEGLVDVGDSTTLAATWSSADGNPAGSLEWQTFSGSTTSERSRRSSTGQTWQTWGVPAGATVTSVQVTAWDYLVWSMSGVSAIRLRFRIVDTSGATVHSAGELVDDTTTHSADGGTVHAGAVGTSRAVDAGSQAAATDVRFEIEFNVTASGTPNVDYEQDNIQLTITYTVGGGGGGGITQVFDPLPFMSNRRI